MEFGIRKPDKQGRILVPLDLVTISKLDAGSVAVCTDTMENLKEGKFYLKNTTDISPDDIVICQKSLDEKHRLYLAKDLTFTSYLIYFHNKLVRVQLFK